MLFRQGSMWTKCPRPFEQSHRVTLSAAKGLSRSADRCFASLSMTELDLAVAEELSSAFEPCLNKLLQPTVGASAKRSGARINTSCTPPIYRPGERINGPLADKSAMRQ